MARVDPKTRRAARHAQLDDSAASQGAKKAPITVERIVEAALHVVATQGYDALTMRSVANVLGTGPASLYAHVVNKADIDELLIGRLFSEIVLPEPDPATWREQILEVCAQIRDQFLRYPGVSRAAMATASTNLDTLRLAEGMLTILVTGGVPAQRAAWAMDAMSLYVNAYTLEIALVEAKRAGQDEDWVVGRDELIERFEALPADAFPSTRRYAAELTSGTGHERFDFTLGLIIDNLD
ncbi:TetR/AcrR family transcriptional regulator [Mycolicibacterium sp. P9-64]|uniref:TetR/AcrR family transcriptional regulator n=1 Tax=Mycolicibacterium sp. P9-64 TaxID=2024612 RepID=UPI0011ECDE7E|nr:TetR/AcrR family transcriptional regulator [Mycolicibacterium sp. P9-64]KAA0084687.1 TetR/AcrR family transcriptional regulator [Mycolicibacterium sp. P9-64]